MVPSSRRALYFVLVLIFAGLAMSLFVRLYPLFEQQRALAFYASALLEVNVSQDVTVHGVRYHVRGGTVTAASSSVPDPEQLRALALAYEVTVAERAPQFGLAGTDPDELEKQIAELSRVQNAVADSLRIPSNRDAVRTSLYPVSFLRALSAAERTRQTFIVSCSDVDALAYRTALGAVIDAQRHDSELFGKAYKMLGYTADKGFPLFGGTIMSGNIEKTVAAIHVSADVNAAILRERDGCFGGIWRTCDSRDLILPLPLAVSSTHDEAAERLAMNIKAMYTEALPEDNAGPLVALSSSTCLASVPGPYIFSDPESQNQAFHRRHPLRYLGDFFFSTSTISVRRLTNQKVNALVDVWSATIFYRCPDKGLDVSRASAVEFTDSFARQHPNIEPAARKKLISSAILHEDDAVEYVRSALQGGSHTPEEERVLIGLALMFQNNSAGLDSVVNDVWTIDENNLKLIQKGYPFDDSLLFFFGSHSAFATFFQTYNPSVVTKIVPIYDRSPGALMRLTATRLRYSAHPEYRAAIVQFLHEYRTFEQSWLE